MHQHKIVARILLMLAVLNSVLAAPVVYVREIPKARGAVAVRVPAEGMAAVLQKRPYEQGTSTGPNPGNPEPLSTPPENSGPQSTTSLGHTGPQLATPSENSGPQSATSPGHTGPQLATPPENSGPQSATSLGHTGPQSDIPPEHTGPQSEIQPVHSGPQPLTSAEHSGLLAMTDEYSGSQRIDPGGVQHYASSSLRDPPPRVSNAAWRQKILTPEKIKATKWIGGAALLTTAYLGLLLPEIFHNEDNNKS